ncbi:unnamed protein product, partial [Prorocentrum cordatum]
RELRRLTDRAAPFPREVAQRVLREEWGSAASGARAAAAAACAVAVPDLPAAAASLCQVYRVRLKGWGVVAVKVQRPDIRGRVCADLYLLRHAARAADGLLGTGGGARAAADEYGRRLVDELDFRREARAASAFAADAARLGLPATCAAVAPVTQLTTRRVLVSPWAQGESLGAVAARDPAEARRLQSVAVGAFMAMLLETGRLHADPHAGNLLRAPDGRLLILDWGLVAPVPAATRRRLRAYVVHVLSGDFEAVPSDLAALGFVAAGKEGALRDAEVAQAIAGAFRRLASGGGARQRVEDVFPALAAVRQRHGNVGQVPASFVYILRTFGILEGLGLSLDPGYRIVDDCLPYVASWLTRAREDEAVPAFRGLLYGANAHRRLRGAASSGPGPPGAPGLP